MTEEKFQQAIRKLIESGNKEEAKDLIVDQYQITNEEAEEYFQKLKKAVEAESIYYHPKTAGKLAQGCGCLSIFSAIIFVIVAYNTYDFFTHSNEVEAEVMGTHIYEEKYDDGIIHTYYDPVISYQFDGVEYTDTLNHQYEAPEYDKGETLILHLDANDPRLFETESFWDSILSYSFLLVFCFVALVAYQMLKSFKVRYKRSKPYGAERPEQDKEEKLKDDSQEEALKANEQDLKIHQQHSSTPEKKNTDSSKKAVILCAILFIGIGLAMLGNLIYNQFRGDRLQEEGVVVIGEVSSTSRSSGSSTTFVDIDYEYKGLNYDYELQTKSLAYDQGDQVELLVSPGDPEDVAVNSDDDLYGDFSMFWFVLFVGLGIFVLRIGLKGNFTKP